MPPALQDDAGCRIARDYPSPIVDQQASRAAFERYALAR